MATTAKKHGTPVKKCQKCSTENFAGSKKCKNCGAEFPPSTRKKYPKKAVSNDITIKIDGTVAAAVALVEALDADEAKIKTLVDHAVKLVQIKKMQAELAATPF